MGRAKVTISEYLKDNTILRRIWRLVPCWYEVSRVIRAFFEALETCLRLFSQEKLHSVANILLRVLSVARKGQKMAKNAGNREKVICILLKTQAVRA